VHLFRRGLRALRYGIWGTRSALVLRWYKLMFPGLIIGRGVRLGRNVYLNVIEGARLELGDYVELDSSVMITVDGSLMIGANSYVGIGTIIAASDRMEIGEDALIDAYVTIRDQDHRFSTSDMPYRSQGRTSSALSIGRNVWIGTKATVLRGVHIGDDCIIGANAVVKSSIPAGNLAAGVPARVIREMAKHRPPAGQE
jgi:acetyltransferase-like isoleucine patch superfamily enzyme